MTRVVCISDTHGMIGQMSVPPGDLLIHAGDLSSRGDLRELQSQYELLNGMPHEHVIVTPGNHDFGFQESAHIERYFAKLFPRVKTLIGSASVVAGIRLWADPWTPWFYDWAFNFSPGATGEREAGARYAKIPDDTQLLITHGPPRGILDQLDHHGSAPGEHVGSVPLRERLLTLPNLRAHVFGHIHCGYGTHRQGDVLFVNAATCTETYHPTNPPIVMEWSGESFDVVADL